MASKSKLLPSSSFVDITVDLSNYFSASELEKMPALEQLAMVNRIKNYEVLHQLGLPTVPLKVFLTKKSAKSGAENLNARRKAKDVDVMWKPSMENTISKKSAKKIAHQGIKTLSGRRYPKRGIPIGIPIKSYCGIGTQALSTTDVDDHENTCLESNLKKPVESKIQIKFYCEAYAFDDNFNDETAFYCDYCRLVYAGERRCSLHSDATCDTVMMHSSLNRGEEEERLPMALETLPDCLIIGRSLMKDAGEGVFTGSGTTLKRGLIFGPFKGLKVYSEAEAQDSGYCWQIINSEGGVSHYIDGRDPQNSNWMRYINCAVARRSRNVMAIQVDENIFYRTVVDIGPNTELCVWYGDDFAQELRLLVS